MSDGLQIDRRGAVLHLTIDRPKANAIDNPLSRALGRAFIDYRDDRNLRCCVMTAAGSKFFSAGWDLKAAAEIGPEGEDYGPGGFAGLTELFDLDKPVIAAINGMAVGGGFELALSADIIIAADHATFFLPETGIGVIPDAGGVFRLPRRVPESIALEMLLTGRALSAVEAMHFGLVNKICKADELAAEAMAMADKILAIAPLAAAAVKQTHRLTRNLSVPDAYAALKAGNVPAYGKLRSSADYYEGAKAFAEKRQPRWSGE